MLHEKIQSCDSVQNDDGSVKLCRRQDLVCVRVESLTSSVLSCHPGSPGRTRSVVEDLDGCPWRSTWWGHTVTWRVAGGELRWNRGAPRDYGTFLPQLQ